MTVRATLVEPFTGSSTAGALTFWTIAYGAFLALALGAAFVGGRLGWRGASLERHRQRPV